MLEQSLRPVGPGLSVLQLGPLYNNHLARWSANAAAIGCTVFAAGHVKPGRRPVELTGLVEHIEVLPGALASFDHRPPIGWLRDVVRGLRPDLIHAHWLPTWAYLAARCADRPLLVTPWGSDVYLATASNRRRGDWAMQSADRVLAHSAHMEREITTRGVLAERIERVDLGVDLQRFAPASAAERVQLRDELALPPGPVILSMRAGTALYNLDVVLDAFDLVRRRVRDATMVLVHGDVPLAEAVRARLDRPGRGDAVRAVGHVAHREMDKYMRAATAAISIPSSDGSPSSVWEALAAGLPVVLSALPQIEEKVGLSGAVRLVQPRPEEVASALVEVIEAPRQRQMARAARAWALQNCEEAEQIERLSAAYGAAIAQRQTAATRRLQALGHRSGRGTAIATAPPRRPS